MATEKKDITRDELAAVLGQAVIDGVNVKSMTGMTYNVHNLYDLAEHTLGTILVGVKNAKKAACVFDDDEDDDIEESKEAKFFNKQIVVIKAIRNWKKGEAARLKKAKEDRDEMNKQYAQYAKFESAAENKRLAEMSAEDFKKEFEALKLKRELANKEQFI